ncbi:hypothetical protein N9K95_03745 [Schleiferiaceae bacterium]|nr:hypothetical protein [Schleiferiaceae bacterium]
MALHHYTAKFRGIASKVDRKNSSRGSLKFLTPKWKEIVLYDIEKIALRDFDEERAGIFFSPMEGVKKRHKPTVIIQSGPDTRIESKQLRKLICYPGRGQEHEEYRHQHELSLVNSNSDIIIWEGIAKFSYYIPDPPKIEISDSDTHLIETPTSLDAVLNEDDWMEIEGTSGLDSSNALVNRIPGLANRANKRLPYGLLLLGLILFFINPLLGLIVLGIAIYSLSRRGRSGLTSPGSPQLGKQTNKTPAPTGGSSNEALSSKSNTRRVSRGGRRLRWITLVGLILAGLMIFKLWSLGSILLWPLALATLVYFIASRNASWGWLVVSRIFFWLLFILSALFILGTLVDTSELLPEDRSEGDARSERVRREGSDIISSRHTIAWQNPIAEGRNEVTYYTGDNPYQASLNAHKSVLNISQNTTARNYWGQVYAKLLVEDNAKVDSLVNVVHKVSKERDYSSLETAEYLVSLIQEIPYVLVHDHSCQQVVNESGGFVRDYHVKRKPCLPNVIAGVQSPYEFMHTLEGDCDTRSLLGHAVLRKLGISSSVWISEQYGHSILGVGVPSTSRAKKTLNGVPHYGVELTAKGFRVGMIAPDQMHMRNWDVAIFKNF